MSITPTVSAIGKLNITGNVIPVAWLSNIVMPSGRADLKAIIILSEIIYWYRPREIRCDDSGVLIGYKKRFSADKLQRSYSSFTNLGMTKREAADAIKRLRDLGLVTLELRTITTSDGNRLPNTLFIEPVVEGIEKATYSTLDDNINEDAIAPPEPVIDVTSECNTPYEGADEVLRETGTPLTSERMTITEITTETATENTTDIVLGSDKPKPKARKKPKSATSAPDEFLVDTELVQWLEENQITVSYQIETEKFLDHHRSKGSTFVDWRSAWRNWMRNAMKFSQQRPNRGFDADQARATFNNWASGNTRSAIEGATQFDGQIIEPDSKDIDGGWWKNDRS